MFDPILYWNEAALEANRVSFTDPEKSEQGGPTLSSRALSIVHLAMHDAYWGASGTTAFGPYQPGLAVAPAGSSVQGAISGAAYTALTELYPKQKSFFDARLSAFTGSGATYNASFLYGAQIARTLLQDRSADPDNSDAGFIPPNGRGHHKDDPDNAPQPYLGAFYGARSRPFAVTARHTLNPPPFITGGSYNPDYITALRQVRGQGIKPELMGTLPASFTRRTPDESTIGIYWGYDGAKGLGTPPRLYNQIIRALAITRGNTTEQNARLFALVNAAMADAGILAWDQKYIHNFWRPVVGIREHDNSLGNTAIPGSNLDDDADPEWLPFGAPNTNRPGTKNFTPPFPAYPSGHATFGAAAFHIARLFYGVPIGDRGGDNLFKPGFASEEMNGSNVNNQGTIRPNHNRQFGKGLMQMIIENGLSRVYLGVHWSFDAFKMVSGSPVFDTKTGGVDLGITIAEDIFRTGLKKSSVPPRP